MPSQINMGISTRTKMLSLGKYFLIFTTVILVSANGTAQNADSLSAVSQDSSHSTAFVPTDSVLIHKINDQGRGRLKITNDLKFARYLITQELYDDANFLLSKVINEVSDKAQQDSAFFFKAWLSYFRQDFVGALNTLYEINNNSKLNTPAQFLKATCFLHEAQYNQSETIFTALTNLADNETAVKNLNLAGIALLSRDYDKFDSIILQIQTNNFLVSNEIESLQEYKAEMAVYKRKSPWLAGFLSALLPGLGKFYVGYRGTPFGALTLNVPLAAIAVETLIISGWTGIPFLIAAPIFGVFYIGNIWGSALSPFAHKREFYDEMDHNILYDLHIPTRRIF